MKEVAEYQHKVQNLFVPLLFPSSLQSECTEHYRTVVSVFPIIFPLDTLCRKEKPYNL